VWLIIIGLFLLVCLASAAALLLFSLRVDTFAIPDLRTFASPAAVAQMPSPTPVIGTVTTVPSVPTALPKESEATLLPTTSSLSPIASLESLTAVAPLSPPALDLSPTPAVQTAAAGDDNIIAATTPSPAPRLGTLIFSAVTQDGRTIQGNVFADKVTEIHAVFTYQNMVDGLPWERRWYLNGRRIAKAADVWDKGATGTFHLTLSAGGSPLSSGRWRLELYVDGNLLQQGEFVIASPTPPPPPTATPLPTPLPSPTAAATATAAPTDTPTAAVVPVYTIAFSRWDGGKYDLFLARTDGSGEKFLLQRAAGPSWSPDGRYLIFYGQEGVDRQEWDGITYHFEGISNGIISMDLRTWSPDPKTMVLRQHVREATARWAAWSPRGDMVAYDARRGGPDWRIYFLGTADNQQYHVEIPGEQADWSPDGNYLVYRSGRENRQGIWVSNRDDSSRVQITAEGSDAFPRWSPDGRKIAFHRDSGQNVDIYVMNPDGSHVRRLTDAPGPDTLPAWTPDGRIVFRSARSGSWGIYIMNADSSGQRLIIPNADPGPDWAFGRMDVR
jgi:TolB protein